MSSALAIGSLLVGQVALAAPFSYRYTDTINDTSTLPAGLANGNTVEITVTLDNGGTSCNSQTWTATHLQSVTFNFNNNTLNTTFTTPFGGALSSTDGNFVSDASGNLTAVMNEWGDNPGALGTDFTTNGDDPNYWFVNGGNPVYNTSASSVELTNVGNMLTASNWSLSGTCTAGSLTPIAVPSGLHFSKQIEIFATEINEK